MEVLDILENALGQFHEKDLWLGPLHPLLIPLWAPTSL
jgi:hypothetical protein